MMSFMKRFILEPLDDFIVGQQMMLNRFGIDEPINLQVYKFSDQFVYGLLKSFYDFKIYEGENVPTEGRVLVCANHQSELDPLVFGVATMHASGRKLHQMAKIDLFQIPIVNAWVRGHFAFPLKRGKKDFLSYLKAKELLEKDEMVGIYPEGTLNPGMGRFLPGHTGAVRLAYETDSPILPMAFYGTDMVYGKGAKYPKFSGKVRVKFGKVMNYDKIFGKTSPDNPNFYQKAIKKVMRKIQDLYYDMFQEEREK